MRRNGEVSITDGCEQGGLAWRGVGVGEMGGRRGVEGRRGEG